MSQESSPGAGEHEVFISYRRLDNQRPGGTRGRDGFVNYLVRQICARLEEDGVVPEEVVVWQDRSKIEPGDIFSEAIFDALSRADLFVAIVSRNYVKGAWCLAELTAMEERLKLLDKPAGEHRIFRVDKHKVPEDQIPAALRKVQAVQFYREDRDAKCTDEFFWGGKVRSSKEYDKALLELTTAIGKRLQEVLEIPSDPKALEPQTDMDDAIVSSNGPVVFVAKPAPDMVEFYRVLVEELRYSGFRVTPNPTQEFTSQHEVEAAIAKAEASIHLLGTRPGRLVGLDLNLVPMQLAIAAEEVKRRPRFERLIWAPSLLPAEKAKGSRDFLKTLEHFGQQLLPTDQIYSGTPVKFYIDVLQRLERKKGHKSYLRVA